MKTSKLEKMEACSEAIEWVKTQKNKTKAWQNCKRGDWMLWLAERLNVDDRKLTLAMFKCANQVRHLMEDKRSIDALDAAEKYGNGKISREELNEAAVSAAVAAAAASYSAYASYASYSAAYAAAYAAVAFAAAASSAAYAAASAAAASARTKSLNKSADICREILTDEVLTAYKKYN
jgi:hypothetical protein